MNRNLKHNIRQSWRYLKKITKPSRIFVSSLPAKLLRHLPISSEILGPPKGFYESTSKLLVASGLDQSEVEASYVEIYPSHEIPRSEPKTLDAKVHWKFYIGHKYVSPTTFVALVPSGRVWGYDGTAVISPDDKLLADASLELGFELPKGINNHSIFRYWKLPTLSNISGTVAVVSSAAGESYFHWIFDVLPRIDLLRRSGISINNIDKFVFNRIHLPFQEETLLTLGITQEKIIETNNRFHIKAERLVVTSAPGRSGNMPKWACDFIRKEFLTEKNPKLVHTLERIYISRANVSRRRVINESNVVDLLDKFGFKSLVLEGISVAEQALIFSKAKVVVAPHGGGLTNIVFCSHGTKIIEIFSPNYVNVCYWALANQVGLEYYYLISEGKKLPDYIAPQYIDEDLSINIDSLLKLMNVANIK